MFRRSAAFASAHVAGRAIFPRQSDFSRQAVDRGFRFSLDFSFARREPPIISILEQFTDALRSGETTASVNLNNIYGELSRVLGSHSNNWLRTLKRFC